MSTPESEMACNKRCIEEMRAKIGKAIERLMTAHTSGERQVLLTEMMETVEDNLQETFGEETNLSLTVKNITVSDLASGIQIALDEESASPLPPLLECLYGPAEMPREPESKARLTLRKLLECDAEKLEKIKIKATAMFDIHSHSGCEIVPLTRALLQLFYSYFGFYDEKLNLNYISDIFNVPKTKEVVQFKPEITICDEHDSYKEGISEAIRLKTQLPCFHIKENGSEFERVYQIILKCGRIAIWPLTQPLNSYNKMSHVIIATETAVYVIDIPLDNGKLPQDLKTILGRKTILKTMYDSQYVVKYFKTVYDVHTVNIYDLKAAEMIWRRMFHQQRPTTQKTVSIIDFLHRVAKNLDGITLEKLNIDKCQLSPINQKTVDELARYFRYYMKAMCAHGIAVVYYNYLFTLGVDEEEDN